MAPLIDSKHSSFFQLSGCFSYTKASKVILPHKTSKEYAKKTFSKYNHTQAAFLGPFLTQRRQAAQVILAAWAVKRHKSKLKTES
ncbi:hypothetical protein ACFLXI_05790 [Chloroflexota bacterium]